MLRRCLFGIALTFTAIVLVAGCHTTGGRGGGEGGVKAARKSSPGEDKATFERRVRAHAHYATGVIYDLGDKPELALQEFYLAAMDDLDNESLVLEISGRLLQNKQLDKARDLLTRATARPGASGKIYARLGFVYSRKGKTDLALEADRTAIKKSPQSLAGYQNLYLNYFENKEPAKAMNALDEAAKARGTDAEFLIGLSELYVNFSLQLSDQRTNANAKALTLLKRAEKLNPADPNLQLRLADGFNLLDASDKAAQVYSALLKQLPPNSPLREHIRAKLADIYLRNSDQPQAAEQLEAIIRDDPANALAYYYLGGIAFDKNQMDKAADYLSKTILFQPDFEQAYYDLASAQLNLKEPDEALVTLDQARKKFPQKFVLEYLTGVAENQQTNYTGAINHFTAAEIIARAAEPGRLTSLFYFQLGAAYERNADYAQAEKYLEKALDLQPNFPEAMNYLGFMWAERGTNLARARELIEKAVEAKPKSAAYLDSMAWVLYKLNQPKAALEYMLKAMTNMEEPDATLYEHLGDIYAALHESTKAHEAWQKSLGLEPNNDVEKKLKAGKSP